MLYLPLYPDVKLKFPLIALYWIVETSISLDITSKYISTILQSTRRNTGLIRSMNSITIEGGIRGVVYLSMEVQRG